MFKHILVPTDGSKLSVKTIKQAVKFAKSVGAKITGFYATPEFGSTYYGDGYILRAPSANAYAEASEKQARKCLSTVEVEADVEKVPCEVLHVVSDSPYEAIIEAAKNYRDDPNRVDGSYTKLPATWLNKVDPTDEDPLPPRSVDPAEAERREREQERQRRIDAAKVLAESTRGLPV